MTSLWKFNMSQCNIWTLQIPCLVFYHSPDGICNMNGMCELFYIIIEEQQDLWGNELRVITFRCDTSGFTLNRPAGNCTVCLLIISNIYVLSVLSTLSHSDKCDNSLIKYQFRWATLLCSTFCILPKYNIWTFQITCLRFILVSANYRYGLICRGTERQDLLATNHGDNIIMFGYDTSSLLDQ